MPQKKIEIDDTDLNILAELEKDARKTYQEIGMTVGMTRPAVRERILRMEDAGIIDGYHASINGSAIGKVLHVMVSFKFNSDLEYHEKPNDILIPILNKSPDVKRYWDIYGDLDFLIEAEFYSKNDLDTFVEELRNLGFVRTHIIITYEELKH